jgi:hypothetical protein
LTRYALGAPAKLLEDTWAYDEPHLVSLDPEAGDRKTDMSKVPKEVTRENWDDPKYLAFEGCVVDEHGFRGSPLRMRQSVLEIPQVLPRGGHEARSHRDGQRIRLLPSSGGWIVA